MDKKQKDKRIRAIRLELQEEVVDGFERASQKLGMPKTKIVKSFIKTISSKQFEMALIPENMELLQRMSEECWKLLNAPGCWLEVDMIKNNHPAFFTNTVTVEPMIHVKYPTYRIDLIPIKKDSDATKIKNILGDLSSICDVVNGPDLTIMGGGAIKNVHTYNVTCFAPNLSDNQELKKTIIKLLKNDYECTENCSCYIRSALIEYYDEKHKLFKIKSSVC